MPWLRRRRRPRAGVSTSVPEPPDDQLSEDPDALFNASAFEPVEVDGANRDDLPVDAMAFRLDQHLAGEGVVAGAPGERWPAAGPEGSIGALGIRVVNGKKRLRGQAQETVAQNEEPGHRPAERADGGYRIGAGQQWLNQPSKILGWMLAVGVHVHHDVSPQPDRRLRSRAERGAHAEVNPMPPNRGAAGPSGCRGVVGGAVVDDNHAAGVDPGDPVGNVREHAGDPSGFSVGADDDGQAGLHAYHRTVL